MSCGFACRESVQSGSGGGVSQVGDWERVCTLAKRGHAAGYGGSLFAVLNRRGHAPISGGFLLAQSDRLCLLAAAAGEARGLGFREGVEQEICVVHLQQRVRQNHDHPRREGFSNGTPLLRAWARWHSASAALAEPMPSPSALLLSCQLSTALVALRGSIASLDSDSRPLAATEHVRWL